MGKVALEEAKIQKLGYIKNIRSEKNFNFGIAIGLISGIVSNFYVTSMYEKVIKSSRLLENIIFYSLPLLILIIMFIFIKEMRKLKARESLALFDLDNYEEIERINKRIEKNPRILLQSRSLTKEEIEESNKLGKKFSKWYESNMKTAGFKFKNS